MSAQRMAPTVFYGEDADRRAIAHVGSVHPRRAVRAPHHTSSMVSLTGRLIIEAPGEGERSLRYQPGEIGLADRGVLLLTDVAEFDPRTLERIGLAFTARRLEFMARETGEHVATLAVPVDFDIVATVRYCPCGMREGFDVSHPRCACTGSACALWNKRTTRALALIRGERVER